MLLPILKHRQQQVKLIFMNISAIVGEFCFLTRRTIRQFVQPNLVKRLLLKDEFAKRNVKVLAVSVDPLDRHAGWVNDINETQNVEVNFPLIADSDRNVATLYDMIHPNASATATVRSLFVIGPDKLVKLIITYPASTGRNFNEVLRVVESLQLTANYSVATPADWNHGEDVIVVPAVSTEDAIQKFPKGVKVVKPYLRYTPQPNL